MSYHTNSPRSIEHRHRTNPFRPETETATEIETASLPPSTASGAADDTGTPFTHAALIYESRADQFETVIPFIAHGLQRGDQCMYMVDDNSPADVLDALRARYPDLDVDAALETGQLVLTTVGDTYLADEPFTVEAGTSLLRSAMKEALAEWDGFRVTAEETWLDRHESAQDDFMSCETHVNDLLDAEECLTLCQYKRGEIPDSVIDEVLKNHPCLIYDGTVCRNVYYQPPEEYFEKSPIETDVDRKLRTLVDRTTTQTRLRDRERYLRGYYEITSDPTRSFEEKLDAVCDLGCAHFDLDLGAMASVDPDTDRLEIEYVSDDHEYFEPGVELPLSETFCTAATDNGTGSVVDPAAEGYDDIYAHDQLGIRAYLGTYLEIEGGANRTFFFVGDTPRDREFTGNEHAIQRLLGQWVKYTLERKHREGFLRRSYEITADPELDFEEKLVRLLDLGRDRMDLELAGLTHVPDWTDQFRNDYLLDSDGITTPNDPDGVLWGNPGNGRYCREVLDGDGPVAVADVRGTDWERDPTYQDRGIACYIGTQVVNGGETYGTLWFGSTTPRDREFSDTECTFVELMGQWVSYELEREHRERALEESNERLQQFAYAASHDLQEPLRMVSSYLQLVEQRNYDELDDDTREFIDFAVDGADRMREMIDGLLEYSRVQTDADPLEPVDLDGVFDDVRTDLQVTLAEAEATITADSLPRVHGDGNQLRQVLQNLLENAITYSGEGPPTVRVTAERSGREWTVSVADDGIGIRDEDHDRVFGVFERGHGREDGSGTGIGLALCEQIIARHDGEIWLDSEPGEGTTVSFTLPAADHEQTTRG
ncbi:MEDS domain-containing protein [Halovivax sp.]|uniref:MEDS domain-containing protein n=1 Tax=Halovivax sp. TaxID=1935978 RepID=UPI0025B8F743|nr:MEDS domain-containing protein [Halovivax sp.]